MKKKATKKPKPPTATKVRLDSFFCEKCRFAYHYREKEAPSVCPRCGSAESIYLNDERV